MAQDQTAVVAPQEEEKEEQLTPEQAAAVQKANDAQVDLELAVTLPRPEVPHPTSTNKVSRDEAAQVAELVGGPHVQETPEQIEKMRDKKTYNFLAEKLEERKDKILVDSLMVELDNITKMGANLYGYGEMDKSEETRIAYEKAKETFRENYSKFEKKGTLKENFIRIMSYPNAPKDYVDFLAWKMETLLTSKMWETDEDLDALLRYRHGITALGGLGAEQIDLDAERAKLADSLTKNDDKFITSLVKAYETKKINTADMVAKHLYLLTKAAFNELASMEQIKGNELDQTELIARWSGQGVEYIKKMITGQGDPESIKMMNDLEEKYGSKWPWKLSLWVMKEGLLGVTGVKLAKVTGMANPVMKSPTSKEELLSSKFWRFALDGMSYEFASVNANTTLELASGKRSPEEIDYTTRLATHMAAGGIAGAGLQGAAVALRALRQAGKGMETSVRELVDDVGRAIWSKAKSVLDDLRLKYDRNLFLSPTEILAENTPDPWESKDLALAADAVNWGEKAGNFNELSKKYPSLGAFTGLLKLMGEIGIVDGEKVVKTDGSVMSLVGMLESNQIRSTKIMIDAARTVNPEGVRLLMETAPDGNMILRFPEVGREISLNLHERATKGIEKDVKTYGLGIIHTWKKFLDAGGNGLLTPSERSYLAEAFQSTQSFLRLAREREATATQKEINSIFSEVGSKWGPRNILHGDRANFDKALIAMNDAGEWFPPEKLMMDYNWTPEMLNTFYTRYIPFIKKQWAKENSLAMSKLADSGAELIKLRGVGGLDGKGQHAVAMRVFKDLPDDKEEALKMLKENAVFMEYVERWEKGAAKFRPWKKDFSKDSGHPINQILHQGKVPIFAYDLSSPWGFLKADGDFIFTVDPGELIPAAGPQVSKRTVSATNPFGEVVSTSVEESVGSMYRVIPEYDGYFPTVAKGGTRHTIVRVNRGKLDSLVNSDERPVQAVFAHDHYAAALRYQKMMKEEAKKKGSGVDYLIISTAGQGSRTQLKTDYRFLDELMTENQFSNLMLGIGKEADLTEKQVEMIRQTLAEGFLSPRMRQRSQDVLQTFDMTGNLTKRKSYGPQEALNIQGRMFAEDLQVSTSRKAWVKEFERQFREFLPTGKWGETLRIPSNVTPTPQMQIKLEQAKIMQALINKHLFGERNKQEAFFEDIFMSGALTSASRGAGENRFWNLVSATAEEMSHIRRNMGMAKTLNAASVFLLNAGTVIQQAVVAPRMLSSRFGGNMGEGGSIGYQTLMSGADAVTFLQDTATISLLAVTDMIPGVKGSMGQELMARALTGVTSPFKSRRALTTYEELVKSGYLADVMGISDAGGKGNVKLTPFFGTLWGAEGGMRIAAWVAARQDLVNRFKQFPITFSKSEVPTKIVNGAKVIDSEAWENQILTEKSGFSIKEAPKEFWKYFQLKDSPVPGDVENNLTLTEEGLQWVYSKASAYNMRFHNEEAVGLAEGVTGWLLQFTVNPMIKTFEQTYWGNKFTKAEKMRFIIGDIIMFGPSALAGGATAVEQLAKFWERSEEFHASGKWEQQPKTAKETLKEYQNQIAEFVAPSVGVDKDTVYKFLRQGVFGAVTDTKVEWQALSKLYYGEILNDLADSDENFLAWLVSKAPGVSIPARVVRGPLEAWDTIGQYFHESGKVGAVKEYWNLVNNGKDPSELEEFLHAKASVKASSGLPGVKRLVMALYASGAFSEGEQMFLNSQGDKLNTLKDMTFGEYLLRIHNFGPSIQKEIREMKDITLFDMLDVWKAAEVTAEQFKVNPDGLNDVINENVDRFIKSNRGALAREYKNVLKYQMKEGLLAEEEVHLKKAAGLYRRTQSEEGMEESEEIMSGGN